MGSPQKNRKSHNHIYDYKCPSTPPFYFDRTHAAMRKVLTLSLKK